MVNKAKHLSSPDKQGMDSAVCALKEVANVHDIAKLFHAVRTVHVGWREEGAGAEGREQ